MVKRRRPGYQGKRKGEQANVQRGEAAAGKHPRDELEPRGSQRKKYAIVFGYNGSGYHGMQRQVDENGKNLVRTIEGDLLEALHKMRAIATDQLEHPERLQWSRVGRTDTGVHAACQVVTAKINVDPVGEGVQAKTASQLFVAALQRQLDSFPLIDGRSSLEIFDVFKAPGGFDARTHAERRHYEYLLPAWVLKPFALQDNLEVVEAFLRSNASDLEWKLLPIQDKRDVMKVFHDENGKTSLALEKVDWALREWRTEMQLIRKVYAALDDEAKRNLWSQCETPPPSNLAYPPSNLLSFCPVANDWTLSDECLGRFNNVLKRFAGTRNWFHFTSGINAQEASVNRFVEDMECFRLPPGENAAETWLVIRVKGQSFLLNQIRKMIALSIEIYLGTAPRFQDLVQWLTDKKQLAADQSKKHIHLAPAQGLLLERAVFSCESAPDQAVDLVELFEENNAPFSSAMQAYLASDGGRGFPGRPRKRLKAVTHNVLLDKAPQDEEPQGQEETEEEPTTKLAWRILKYKHSKLFPAIAADPNSLDNWQTFLKDVQWYPFFLENFSAEDPVGPSHVIAPLDKTDLYLPLS